MNIFLVIVHILCIPAYCAFPEVKIEEGNLAGINFTLINGKVIRAFLGVPYASPPLGAKRFEAPRPIEPWSTTRNASVTPCDCLQLRHQPNSHKIVGDEDCLYLNVFTPKIPAESDHLMNVVVYVPGGAFMFGSGGKIYPDYLMDSTDVVFVSINYRLGVLGFFSTGDEIAPGNFGLKDQVEALRWVRRNIRYFNGDPSKVTLFGNSAGGASVHYHYFSPLSVGLFHNGISLSGTVLNPWARPKKITEKSLRVASLLNCSTGDTASILKCLRTKSANEIVETTKHFLMWRYCPFTPFGPVVEAPNPTAFLPVSPIEMLRKKKLHGNVPWLVGMVEKEGLYPGAEIIPNDHYLKDLNDRWYEIAPNLLAYNFSVPELEKDNVSFAIKRHYFGDRSISRETREELIQMLGDRLFYTDIHHALKLHAAADDAKEIYCYNFLYKGKYSPYTQYFARNSENYGTGHGDDQFFIINSGARFANKTGSDAAMVQYMTKFIANFIKFGQPNAVNQSEHIDWVPVVTDNPVKCKSIYQPGITKLESIGSEENDKFWKKLLPSEYSGCPVVAE